MKTIRLYGDLGKKFGRVHRLDVATAAEAIRALCANFPAFRSELENNRAVGYRVVNGRHELGDEREVQSPLSKTLRIIPVVVGASGATKVLLGFVLVVAAFVLVATGVGAAFTPYMFKIGAVLILGGVAEMLSPPPKVDGPQEPPDQKPSYLFNGPVNTAAQGHPVPLLYGRMVVGSAIISAGITSTEIRS